MTGHLGDCESNPPTPHPTKGQLQAFVQGQISDEQAVPFEAHLANCPVCCELLRQAGDLSDELVARLESALQDQSTGIYSPHQEPADPIHDNSDSLQTLSTLLPSVPRVNLQRRDNDVIIPIHSPFSEKMPDKQGFPQRYQIVGEIARGGMGAILKGRDTDLGRDIAVKVMLDAHKGRAELLQRFLEEAQIGGQLQHPGIVPVYELGHSKDKRPYFTMKLVKGNTLAELLKKRSANGVASAPRDTSPANGVASAPREESGVAAAPRSPADLPKFLGIFEQICQTMAYSHASGVIHRDLKPANIMVGSFGEVQVMDWGLAKVLAKASEVGQIPDPEDVTTIRTARSGESNSTKATGSNTRAGSVLGTPAFMAPEQANGNLESLDERCDVFGLGAILCAILTGKPPYVGKDASEIHKMAMKADLADAQQRLQNCGADRALIELANQCLRVNKKDRPRDAGVLSDAVTAYLESVQVRLKQAEIDAAEAHVRAESEQKQRELAEGKAVAERKRRRATLVLVAAAILFVGTVGVGGFAAWQQTSLEQKRCSAGIDRIYQLIEKYRYKEAQETANTLTNTLSFWVPQNVRGKLEESHKDADFLAELDRVSRNRATFVDGEFFNPKQAAKQYERVFQDFSNQAGFAKSGAVISESMTMWIRSCPDLVGDRVLAALDDWAVCLAETKEPENRNRILATIGRIDRNEMRNQIRREFVRNNPKKLAALIVGLDPKDCSAQLLHSVALQIRERKGNQETATFLERVQVHHPADFWLLYTLANSYQKLNRPDAAIGCYRAALAARPSVAGVYDNWGITLYSKKDFKGAAEKFEQAAGLDPKTPSFHFNWGLALYHQKDWNGAIAKFKKAAALDPKFVKAYVNWGLAVGYKGNYHAAIAKYKKAAEVDPNCESAYVNWANLLSSRKHYDEAIEKYKLAIAANPQDADVCMRCAKLLRNKQDHAGAIAMLKKAIDADRKYVDAYYNWGNQFRQKQDYEGAIAMYKMALKHQPDDAEATCNLGLSLLNQGKFDSALEYLSRGHGLGVKMGPDWRYPSADWVLTCQHCIAFDKKLHVLLQGKPLPTNPANLLQVAKFCRHYKKNDPAAVKLAKRIESQFRPVKMWKGMLTNEQKEQTHKLKLRAGKTYVINLQSKQFDCFLRLQDAKGQILMEDDDGGDGLNSQIIFTPKQDDAYNIVATSFQKKGRGRFSLSVRAFGA